MVLFLQVKILNNYWMRLSIISGIVEIEEDIADNTLRDHHNSSDDTRAELNIFLLLLFFQIIPSPKVS